MLAVVGADGILTSLCRLNFDQGLRLPPQEVSCG
jgi:hypothetical protein